MARQPAKSRSRSPLGRLARVLSGLAGLAIVVAALIGAFLLVTPLRKLAVESLLTITLGFPVEIDGPVAVSLGPTVTIAGSTIRIERAEKLPSGDVDTIDSGRVTFGLNAALGGRFDMRSLTLDGVRLARNSKLVGFDPDSAIDDTSTLRWFGVVPGMVRLAKHADIAVTDVHYSYQNTQSGWVFDIAGSSIRTHRDPDTGNTGFTIAGTVNTVPVSIDGEIHPVDDGDGPGDGFTLVAGGPGGTMTITSVLPTDAAAGLRETKLAVSVSSIGDLLDAVKIARTVEGTASLSADVDTSQGVSAMRNITSKIDLDDGPTITVDGAIASLESREGFDLTVDAAWPQSKTETLDDDGLLTFQIYDITARLTGGLKALEMTDGWITTNLFSDALPSFGPISAGAVRRDDKGRIEVEDIRVLAGPAGDRTFDLTGRVGDLLQLSDFRLSGEVSIPTAAVLHVDEKSESGHGLGRLEGTFAVSDASGAAGVDTFTARLTGTTLATANVSLKASQETPEETATFSVSLAVPDYATLATALGLDPKPVETFRYKGDVALSDQTGTIDGALTFGKTDVSGHLTVSAKDGRPLITGKVSTPALVMIDARRAVEVAAGFQALWTKQKDKRLAGATAPKRHAAARERIIRPHSDIEVAAAKIVGAGNKVSGVSGRVLVDQGMVTAKSFGLTYDSGHFAFDGQMNTRDASLPFSARGKVTRWPLDVLLTDMQLDLPITGVLEASFDLSSAGTAPKHIFANAKGDLYTRIVDGEIGNRLLDLSGLVFPSWLFSPAAKTGRSTIECFEAKMKFVPGLTTLQQATVETDEVIVHATGLIDFKDETINIEAQPKALHPNLIPIVSPFAIRGSFSDPKVVVKGGVAGRAVAETLALPFNTLGTLLGVDRAGPKPRDIAAGCR